MLENNEASGWASPIISHQGKDADCIFNNSIYSFNQIW